MVNLNEDTFSIRLIFAGKLFHREHPIEQNDFDPNPLTFGTANAPLPLNLVLYECMEG